MTRGGRTRDRAREPERRCIATGEVRPVSELVRFVVDPAGNVVPDIAGKLPGRGIWISADRDAIERAARKGLLARAARQKVQVPADLADLVERLLAERVVELVSLARKSGAAVAGYEKVKDWLARDRAEVLMQATDGSERGKSRLSTPYGGTWIGWLRADELGRAFGREKVIHAALASGGLAQRVVEEARRLKGLRANDGGTAAGKD